MKRLLRSWVFWAFVVLGPLLGSIALTRKVLRTRLCKCGTRQTVREWCFELAGRRTGPWWRSEHVEESPAYLDILSGSHAHGMSATGVRNASLWGSEEFVSLEEIQSLTGMGMIQPAMLHAYNHDPAFREFIREKRRRGEAARDDCAAILSLSDRAPSDEPTAGDLASRREAWRAEFKRVNANAQR